jgi:hypothetical protein
VQAITFAFADCPLCKAPIEHPSLTALLEPIRSLQVPPTRVRSNCRFRKRGTEYVSESGMKWMRVVQSDNATEP